MEYDKEFEDYFGIDANIEYRTFTLFFTPDSTFNLALFTTNEEMILTDFSCQSLVATNNNGDIVLNCVSSEGDISLTNKNADITGTTNGFYDDYLIDTSSRKAKLTLPSNKNDSSKKWGGR